MHIYRNKENKKLYSIEHLILDIKFTNANSNAGIYASPYNHTGERIEFKNKNENQCKKYVNDNFEIVAQV